MPRPEPVALFFADSHLDSHTWKNKPELRGDSFYAFKQIVDLAVEHNLEVIAGGDLIDIARPSSTVMRFMREQLDRLRSASVPFYYIQGQHELDRETPWIEAVHAWPEHVTEEVFLLRDNTVCYGLDWQSVDVLPEKLNEIPSHVEILVCHQVWEELMGSLRTTEGSLTSIRHASTVLTGDYHETVCLDHLRGADGQKMYVISPGSTNMRSITEANAKHVFILNSDGSWTQKKLKTRPVFNFTIKRELDLDKFIEKYTYWIDDLADKRKWLPPSLRKPIVYVVYTTETYIYSKEVKDLIGDAAFYFQKVQDTTETEEVIVSEEEEAVSASILGKEKRYSQFLHLFVKKKTREYRELRRLLDASDPVAELVSLRDKRGLKSLLEG